MLKVGLALPLGVALYVLGQTEAIDRTFPYADLLASGSAVAVLGWAVWYAYMYIIPRQQDGFAKTLDTLAERHERMQKETLDRHERWEHARHEDSERISDCLTKLSSTCAQTQSKLLAATTHGQNPGTQN